jgi:hypothetical protein
MIGIDIRGMPELQRMLRNLAKDQMPYAISSALNSTAFAVQKESRKRLESVFDRPTPLIKGATRVDKATKQNLAAKVFIDPKRESVLKVHEEGGKRGDQTLERYLRSKGWLAAGWKAVPTDKMPLNSYGNPRQAEVKKIITGLPVVSGIRGQARRYFVVPAGSNRGLSAGIYRTLSRSGGRAIMKLYHFVSRTQYKKRLEWLPRMEVEARRLLPGLMTVAIERAIRTAK